MQVTELLLIAQIDSTHLPEKRNTSVLVEQEAHDGSASGCGILKGCPSNSDMNSSKSATSSGVMFTHAPADPGLVSSGDRTICSTTREPSGKSVISSRMTDFPQRIPLITIG